MGMRTFVAFLAAFALMTAACGGGVGSRLFDDPDAPVLQVRSEGGFAPAMFLLNRAPRYALTAGGDLIFEGPGPGAFPGPMLIGLQATRVDAVTMEQILEVVDAMGLAGIDFEANTEASSRVADATTEVVTFFDAEGRPHRFSVYALGLVSSSDPRVARFEELAALLEEVAASGTAVPYVGQRLQVWVGPAEGSAERPVADVRDWPLPEAFDDLVPVFAGWRCTTYEGAERDRLVELFSDATQATRWRSGDAEYTMLARPLVPGEEPCAAPAGPG